MTTRRFELTDGGSNKFWQVRLEETELHIAWGKLGTAGQSQVKTFGDAAAAKAAAAKLVKEKTGKGYVEVSSGGGGAPDAAEARGTVALSYVIADFDAEDTYAFDVDASATALELAYLDAKETVEADALASAPGVWVLLQESPSPETRGPAWTPPFVVSHAIRDALARDGECTLHTGFAPERAVVLARVEPDALDEETAEVLTHWKGKVLCARSDDGDELIVANAATPQLLAFRTDDVCTITWTSGVLDGARAKAPKPAKKPAAAGGKRQTSAQVLASPDAPIADRIKAAKALGKAGTPAALDALSAQLGQTDDRQLGAEISNQLSRVFYALRNAGETYDMLPRMRELVASSQEIPLPEPTMGDFDPISTALSVTMNFLSDDRREETTAFLRDLAWTSLRGGATNVARMHLVSRGDEEAIDRVSNMLADRRIDTAAAAALAKLPAPIAIARAKTQLEELDGAARADAARRLFSAIELDPSIDHAAWFGLLHPELGDSLAMWVATNLERLGPPSETLALLAAKEYRAWRDADLATKLAAFPPDLLTEPVVNHALDVSDSFDVSALLAAAKVDTIARTLATGREQDPEWAPPIPACIALAARHEGALRAALEAFAALHEGWDPEAARPLREALAG